MSKILRVWHFNRPQPLRIKFKRWSTNPVGALIRIIEFGYFRVPLVSLLKNVEHLYEVSHLNLDTRINGEDVCINDNLVHLKNNLVMLNSGHVLFVKMSYQSFLSGLHADEIRQLQRSRNVQVFSNAIPLSRQEYYFHFVAEYLPEILRIYSNNRTCYVLSHSDQPKFVIDYLKLLEIPVMYVAKPVVRLRSSFLSKEALGNEHNLLVKFTDELIKSSNASWPDKIIILRRGLARDDKGLNIELNKILSAYGFQEMVMEDLTIESQISLFRHAKRVVALHGGALTNLIYSEPGTDVLEIFSGIYRNYDYAKIAQKRNLQYLSVDSSEIELIKSWADKNS